MLEGSTKMGTDVERVAAFIAAGVTTANKRLAASIAYVICNSYSGHISSTRGFDVTWEIEAGSYMTEVWVLIQR